MVHFALLLMLTPVIWSDIGSRRIPNTVIAVSLLTSLSVAVLGWLQGASTGLASPLVTWLAGLGVGLASLMPLYVLRAMGAGDVKLMAACGACLGPQLAWQAALLALVLGGVMALAWHARAGSHPWLMWPTLHRFGPQPARPSPLRKTAARLPFSLPILLASLGTAWT
jgi:Flp pilus assembly protein protease CpaA